MIIWTDFSFTFFFFFFAREVNNLDIERARKLAEIESKKFADIVRSIGPDTIATIAQAGPEMQVKMLQALGLKVFSLLSFVPRTSLN